MLEQFLRRSVSPPYSSRVRNKDRSLLIYLIAIPLFFLFTLLLVQFYKIQVLEAERWYRLAHKQHHLFMVEPHLRGVFYSNGTLRRGHPEQDQPLVFDMPCFHLYADAAAIPDQYREEIFQSLKDRLGSSCAQLEEEQKKKSRSLKVATSLTKEQKELIISWWHNYASLKKLKKNLLFLIKDYKRSYPFGKLLGQLLHTVRSEVDPFSDRRYIPTGGLEASLDHYLKGKDGKRSILRSPRHPLELGELLYPAQDGADVYLTINHHLQAIVEEEIAAAVERAEAKAGWAIMMDPVTGEIWAWAQYPFFDPIHYRNYFNDPEKEKATKLKAITDPFEPGSIMKPITLAVALHANEFLRKEGKKGFFTVGEKIDVHNGFFPGRQKPIKETTRYYKALNMYMGLQRSSNVYMARLVERLIGAVGEHWYRSALEELFGFGVKTSIQLGGESSGKLPFPGKVYPNGRLEWSKATPFSLAIGYNLLATSMQMIRSYAILANGGHDVHPTLVRKIISKEGKEIVAQKSAPSLKRLLSRETVSEVVRAMRYTTHKGGSASRAHIPGYSEAGKTGTAEKSIAGIYSKSKHISSFIGFAPLDAPRFVLLISIDEPAVGNIHNMGKNQMAGVCAAPAFSKIGKRTLQFLGVSEDDPRNEQWNQEAEQLNKLYTLWNN